MSRQNFPAKGYPFKIPKVSLPDEDSLRFLGPASIWAFLRYEALLRSEGVWSLYEKGKKRTEKKQAEMELLRQFGMTWQMFKGQHHCFLDPKDNVNVGKILPWVPWGNGYVVLEDLEALLERTIKNNFEWTTLIGNPRISNSKDRLVTVIIDTAHPIQGILQALEPVLEKRHKDLSRNIKQAIRKARRQRNTTVLKTNLNYFACYDLKYRDGRTPSQIGKKLNPGAMKPTEWATTAIRRAKNLICSAETGNWPPL